MVFFLKKNKKDGLLHPIKSKGSSILEDEKFTYPEDRLKPEEDENRVNYLRKPHGEHGIMAALLSGVGLIWTILAVRLTLQLKGNPDLLVSAMAASSLLFSAAALVYSILSLRRKDVKHILAFGGILLGGGQLVLWLAVVVIGL